MKRKAIEYHSTNEPSGQRATVPAEKILMSVRDVITMTGVGRTTLYALIKTGAIRAHKIGRKTVFSTRDIREWVRTLPSMNTRSWTENR